MKKQVKKTKKAQSGRSMIEMIGVLAVMALITAGAFVLISSANSSQKRNRAIDDIMEITAGVRSLYAERDTLPEINSDIVLAAIGKSETGPYSGSKYVVRTDSATQFSVILVKMPEKDCQALEIKNWKDADDKVCKETDFFVQFSK